jgi:large subunit ribosomal protein L3
MRTGLVARKLGMTRIFTAEAHAPATVLQLEHPVVIGQKTQSRDGYNAVVVACTLAKAKNVAKQQKGVYAKAKLEPRKKMKEFRVSEKYLVPVGSELLASHFVPGQFIDATATSIGKGFAGGMKRHNFSGLEASHGVSVSHRSIGSTGQCQDPGRVFPGKKMPGHMGSTTITQQNLEILQIDDERGLIIVKGSIPGSKGSYVELQDAVKIVMPQSAPIPAGIKPKQQTENSEQKEEATN